MKFSLSQVIHWVMGILNFYFSRSFSGKMHLVACVMINRTNKIHYGRVKKSNKQEWNTLKRWVTHTFLQIGEVPVLTEYLGGAGVMAVPAFVNPALVKLGLVGRAVYPSFSSSYVSCSFRTRLQGFCDELKSFSSSLYKFTREFIPGSFLPMIQGVSSRSWKSNPSGKQDNSR